MSAKSEGGDGNERDGEEVRPSPLKITAGNSERPHVKYSHQFGTGDYSYNSQTDAF